MRYDGEKRVWMPGRIPGTSVEVVVRPPTVWNRNQYIRYTTTAADTMLTLSYKHHGSCDAYWAIADLNPRIHCPHDLRSNMAVAIPVGS